MECQRCKSKRICDINAKSSDLNEGTIVNKSFEGYVPHNVGIGGGDYVDFSWCLECGQIQGIFPLDTPELIDEDDDDDDDDEDDDEDKE